MELFCYSDFSWRYERFVHLYVLDFELVVFDQIFYFNSWSKTTDEKSALNSLLYKVRTKISIECTRYVRLNFFLKPIQDNFLYLISRLYKRFYNMLINVIFSFETFHRVLMCPRMCKLLPWLQLARYTKKNTSVTVISFLR